ncbi:phage holin family protein [Lysinibacillus louembei]|uniref:Phage holin family protein n=1 Tax=Lysinibacillus louembei TaxID=1470088 RepID=A0ABZ0S077_9BACI|nr:phage holin family protein [Lysinibacillus louembei]WPK12593.1 phage holin family protein [Lysinibacillus louembei]
MEMIDYLQGFLESDSTKLIYILSCILFANILDTVVGWLNAKLNKKVKFSSSKAIFGVARKITLFVVLVYAIPVALLMPKPLGISALYALYIVYLLSEINSILNHFKLAEDDKSMDPFIEFFKGLLHREGK